jgi:hypothetical protein
MVHFKFVWPFSDKVYKCMREGLGKVAINEKPVAHPEIET